MTYILQPPEKTLLQGTNQGRKYLEDLEVLLLKKGMKPRGCRESLLRNTRDKNPMSTEPNGPNTHTQTPKQNNCNAQNGSHTVDGCPADNQTAKTDTHLHTLFIT